MDGEAEVHGRATGRIDAVAGCANDVRSEVRPRSCGIGCVLVGESPSIALVRQRVTCMLHSTEQGASRREEGSQWAYTGGLEEFTCGLGGCKGTSVRAIAFTLLEATVVVPRRVHKHEHVKVDLGSVSQYNYARLFLASTASTRNQP